VAGICRRVGRLLLTRRGEALALAAESVCQGASRRLKAVSAAPIVEMVTCVWPDGREVAREWLIHCQDAGAFLAGRDGCGGEDFSATWTSRRWCIGIILVLIDRHAGVLWLARVRDNTKSKWIPRVREDDGR